MSANPKKLPRAKAADAEPVKALTVIERAAQALAITQTEDQLRELAQASTSLTVITNPAGLDQVHGARMVLKNTRIEIEKKGKAAREDANAFSKAVIAKEKELIGIISPEELRLQGLQDAYEAEQKRIKDEQIAREQKRVADIQARIAQITSAPVAATGLSAARIGRLVEDLETLPIDETFEEFILMAQDAKVTALAKLNELHAGAIAREAAAAAEKAEREAEAKRLADERAELERRKAEQDRKDREAQAQRDADAAVLRKQQDELDRQRREAEERQKAEEDRIAAERKKFEEEQAAFRKQQEEAAERARIAALPPEPTPEPPAPVAPADPAPLPLAATAAPERPDDNLIIGCIANEWDVSLATALRWITEVAARRAA